MAKKQRSARRRNNAPIGDEDAEPCGDVDVVSKLLCEKYKFVLLSYNSLSVLRTFQEFMIDDCSHIFFTS